jgi:hypothetical protein
MRRRNCIGISIVLTVQCTEAMLGCGLIQPRYLKVQKDHVRFSYMRCVPRTIAARADKA